MERDENVVLVGEDVGRPGGPYGVTRGLLDKFGDPRVRDTPISEAVLVGLGVGGGASGLRPVVEIMFFDFAMIAMDQIVNQAAKFRYFSGASMPLVIRTMAGAGGPNGAQHSQNFEAWYCAVPGLKVVMPSNAADAKGLLKSSIRDDDPVLFIETLGLLTARRDVPVQEDFLIPIGVADIRRPGTDVTVVAIGRLVDRALEAAETLQAEHGISVEVDRPAHALAARHRHDPRLGPAHRPARRRAGGDRAVLVRLGGVRARRRVVPERPQGAADPRDLTVRQRADARPARRGACPRRRRRRRRRPQDHGSLRCRVWK